VRLARRRSLHVPPPLSGPGLGSRAAQADQQTFPLLEQAREWQRQSAAAMARNEIGAYGGRTLREVVDEWHAAALAGVALTRSGQPYKPSTARNYELALRRRVVPALGEVRLRDLRRPRLQRLVDELRTSGLEPSTCRNTVIALQAVLRFALAREEMDVNPARGLQLPIVRLRRVRIATPEEAVRLLAVLPERDCAIWATAFYAGLRLGELRALLWTDIDLQRRIIEVRRSFDIKAGVVPPKYRSSERRVPILRPLEIELHNLRKRTWRTGMALGLSASRPFDPKGLRRRAKRAWDAAGLEPIGLHECRHTFASLLIDAGVNAQAIKEYIGHSSIATTFDLYGHLMPGSHSEVARRVDRYLEERHTNVAAVGPGEAAA
jgi:integrase